MDDSDEILIIDDSPNDSRENSTKDGDENSNASSDIIHSSQETIDLHNALPCPSPTTANNTEGTDSSDEEPPLTENQESAHTVDENDGIVPNDDVTSTSDLNNTELHPRPLTDAYADYLRSCVLNFLEINPEAPLEDDQLHYSNFYASITDEVMDDINEIERDYVRSRTNETIQPSSKRPNTDDGNDKFNKKKK